ncbi:uncharacterized protein SRS1_16093 [Sporisorium reilianum f. sp. reilianum]|uniref:Uncharacterized protein n=1 Tax=Sporisorium reilianum f. sp. reilianum TaxID=72559 RepID=A0A2N8UKG3_9BASI|nr:uncharacterized protein SRS1_16093 [Sporisorium reilianum f. sp. reilianum]
MAASTIVLTLLSLLSSWVVLMGSVISALRAKRRCGRVGQGGWRRVQLCVCLLDALLLLAVAPLFVVHEKSDAADSIWDTGFKTPATTFAVVVALVLRPVIFTAVAASAHVKRRSTKRLQVVLPLAAVAVVAGIATVAAVRCSSLVRQSTSCAAAPFIKILIITSQIILAACATIFLFMIASSTKSTNKSPQRPRTHPRASTVAPRAPSLSLLIHTQPDPWTRHIDLDSPIKEFGQHRPRPAPSPNYGPQLVHGILGTTGSEAATASLGYASAVASSTNPYHLGGSVLSLASRDALTGASRIDLVAAGVGRYATTTSKSSAPLGDFGGASLSSRTPSPRLMGEESRPHSRLSATATEELLLDRRAQNSSVGSEGESVRVRSFSLQLAACLSSLWCPIALSSTALLMTSSSGQTFILLASFCFPATVLLIQELALGCSSSKQHPSSKVVPQIQYPATEPSSPRASIASSAVIVYDTPDSLRNRRPHLRSRSLPLESELNGYTLLNNTAKQRQSLSSAKSVPYLNKHWAAGKVSGDRVVAPRSSLVRGLNLMLNPKPRLEVLPCAAQQHEYAVKPAKARYGGARQSIPDHVTSAVVEGLLEVPSGQGQWTADSERTCITQCYAMHAADASSSMVSLRLSEAGGESADGMSRQEQPDEVILDMDDTPGSPRLRTDLPPLNDHADLQSPTKRQPAALRSPLHTPKRPETLPAASPSFSHDDSQVMGNSASRLFSEIMDILRGNTAHSRATDQRGGSSFNQSLRRSPPKGYASIDGDTARKDASKYDSAAEECDTIVIHSLDSSSDFRTAASQGGMHSTASHSLVATRTYDGEALKMISTIEHEHQPAETELVRKGSTSSTLSFSSISSRIRSLRRATNAANATPTASPQVKKIRSRTFASAFGIELGMLNRNGSKGRRDTPGSHIDSSPSTSAGTCPSSLMDLSFSPSPAAARQTARLFGEHETPSPNIGTDNSMQQGAKKAHRRNLSRADSIMDMLDDEHGDTIEEMLDTVDDVSCASHVDEECGSASGWTSEKSLPEQLEVDLDDDAGFGEECEVDLGDMTVHDAWERCFQQDGFESSEDGLFAAKHGGEDVSTEGEGDYDLMGFDTRRLVARAPFLDTVEEEPEDELAADGSELQQLSSAQHDLLDATSDDVQDKSSSNADRVNGIEDAAGASRESLLLEREAEQRRITELLMEHEVMFPHKTLSRIEEVTEAATTLRASGFRTISAASASKLIGDKTSSTADAGSIRLGLPLSLACQGAEEGSGSDTPDSKSTVSADTVEVDDREPEPEERQLPFVTPRSRMRRRAAAGRRAAIRSFSGQATSPGLLQSPGEQAQVDPSPRSRSVRLGQLGMDQGIWMQSPIKLQLDDSASADNDESSFQLIDTSSSDVASRSTRLRRTLSLTRSKATTEPKAPTALTMRKLVRLDHRDSPKRELRDRLAKTHSASQTGIEANSTSSPQHEKRLPHKPIKKRRKSRIKGVAVMIARHQFTVVDEDDSLIQRYSAAAQPRGASE